MSIKWYLKFGVFIHSFVWVSLFAFVKFDFVRKSKEKSKWRRRRSTRRHAIITGFFFFPYFCFSFRNHCAKQSAMQNVLFSQKEFLMSILGRTWIFFQIRSRPQNETQMCAMWPRPPLYVYICSVLTICEWQEERQRERDAHTANTLMPEHGSVLNASFFIS